MIVRRIIPLRPSPLLQEAGWLSVTPVTKRRFVMRGHHLRDISQALAGLGRAVAGIRMCPFGGLFRGQSRHSRNS
jgi:hypothetical protein